MQLCTTAGENPFQNGLCKRVHAITDMMLLKQGGQSCGQHDGVHGFPETVKSFINFVILSKISCDKVQKKPSYCFALDCVNVSPGFVEVSKITSTN